MRVLTLIWLLLRLLGCDDSILFQLLTNNRVQNVMCLISISRLLSIYHSDSITNWNNWFLTKSRDITVRSWLKRYHILMEQINVRWPLRATGLLLYYFWQYMLVLTSWESTLDHWIQVMTVCVCVCVCVCVSLNNFSGWLEETWTCQSGVCSCQTSTLCSPEFSYKEQKKESHPIKMPHFKMAFISPQEKLKAHGCL